MIRWGLDPRGIRPSGPWTMEKGVPGMWYVGIDQHKRYLTICVRNEQGDVVQRRQVKTAWVEVQRFLERLAAQAAEHGG